MSVKYTGDHSITFIKTSGSLTIARNSWTDFHLIPVTRPYVANGEPVISIIRIPGTSKRIDVTEHLTSNLIFGNRTGTWEFYIDHDQWSDWTESYNDIANYFHGAEIVLSLDDDPNRYYSGVIKVSSYNAESDYSKIVLEYDLDHEYTYKPNRIYPIKFVYEDGTLRAFDYGIALGASYITQVEDLNVIADFYDLILLDE